MIYILIRYVHNPMLLHVLDIASTHWQWVVKVDGKPYSKPMIVRKRSLEGTKWQIRKNRKKGHCWWFPFIWVNV